MSSSVLRAKSFASRQRIYDATLSFVQRRTRTSAAAAALRRKAIQISNAPPSISKIPDEGTVVPPDASLFIRQVGCTRRVFLLQPHMTEPEMEGLAYRLSALTKNEAINSILIATDDNDDGATGALPSSLLERDDPYLHNESFDDGFPQHPPGMSWHVSGGYDPLQLYQSQEYKLNPTSTVDKLLTSLRTLAVAMRGDFQSTKIPVILIPHGTITDAGFVFCLSSYVMATRETAYRITNPSKGLSLDPVGLSYILPRIGHEFGQKSKKYSMSCAMILALTGYEADAFDLLETGLATNFMESPKQSLGSFERTLAEIPPWNQQGLLKKPVRFYGQHESAAVESPSDRIMRSIQSDHNAQFRNVAVADAVHCFSSYQASGAEMWDTRDEDDYGSGEGGYLLEDPSLETDPLSWHAERSSDLVDIAATFDDIFTNEPSVSGILERFREIAARKTNDPEEQEGIDVAADFVERMERQSPLALSVVHRLLQLGAVNDGTNKTNTASRQTFAGCMKREQMAQAKMLQMDDFQMWAKHALKRGSGKGKNKTAPFTSWKHDSVDEVSPDEVNEILELS